MKVKIEAEEEMDNEEKEEAEVEEKVKIEAHGKNGDGSKCLPEHTPAVVLDSIDCTLMSRAETYLSICSL
jgi:hypothetical protein